MPEATPAAVAGERARVFVVQEHHARAPHWDLRLEHEGVLASWALPKGVPMDPGEDHLAVPTEDHPMEYADFTGRIPRGEYGAGTVTLFDRGTYEPVTWEDDEVKVVLRGRRLSGPWVLFRTGESWMIHRGRQPLPEAVMPMLASTGPLPRDDSAWAYEMKWDGVRALARIEEGQLRLRSRTGNDITACYPELRGMGRALGGEVQALLDGEIVAFDGPRPSFAALQKRMNVSSPAKAARLASQLPVTYLAFDLLHLGGRPLLTEPYRERRAVLEGLGLAGSHWQVPPVFMRATGEQAMRASLELGLEGIVAKRLDSPYRQGRSPHWRKHKHVLRQEAVVGGYQPGGGGRIGRIGSLLIGVHAPEGLAFAGHVGTGFTEATLRLLAERLAPLRRATSPFATAVPPEHARTAVWVEPVLVVEVAFTEWTRTGRMRAPVYKGLRDDKDPGEVIREA